MIDKLKPFLIQILIVLIGVVVAAWVMAYIKPLNPSNLLSKSSGNQDAAMDAGSKTV